LLGSDHSERERVAAAILGAMSTENVELIRAMIPPAEVDVAALFRDDRLFEATVKASEAVIDPEVESFANWQGGTRYTGVEGFRQLWLDWLEPWESYHVEVDEMIDAGDKVVCLIRDRGRRPEVDAEIEIRASSVWEIRDGKVVKVAFYTDRAAAFEAAGLEL
jgi:ketosteroid isomerase-like protein